MLPRALALIIVSVVTVVWALTITAPYWRPGSPAPNPAIHFVFMAVVGSALTLKRGASSGSALDAMTRAAAALRTPEPPPVPPPAESETPS